MDWIVVLHSMAVTGTIRRRHTQGYSIAQVEDNSFIFKGVTGSSAKVPRELELTTYCLMVSLFDLYKDNLNQSFCHIYWMVNLMYYTLYTIFFIYLTNFLLGKYWIYNFELF